jgi:hypothetical protein
MGTLGKRRSKTDGDGSGYPCRDHSDDTSKDQYNYYPHIYMARHLANSAVYPEHLLRAIHKNGNQVSLAV